MTTPFNPSWTVEGQTMVWQRHSGTWVRHLVRRTTGSQSYWSPLVRVTLGNPVCMVCLGQHVTVSPDEEYPDGLLHCRTCGATYGFV